MTDKEFKEGLERILGDAPAKIWLARGAGHRVDTVFSIGTAQNEPARIFDEMNGLYLLGEGVPPDLLPGIHNLFEQYCETHEGNLYSPNAANRPVFIVKVGSYPHAKHARSHVNLRDLTRLRVKPR